MHKNSDANFLQTQIEKELNIKTQTSANIRLLDTPLVMAVVDFLKFIYFKDELYRANFLTFLGLNPKDSLDTSWFNIDWKLSKMVKEIVDRYEMFDGSLEILSFIELVDSYSDIDSFLFDLENIRTSFTKQDSNTIKILTIHKSKG